MPRTKSAKAQRRELEDRLACIQLESQIAMVEQGAQMMEAIGDIVPREDYQSFDDPTYSYRRYGREIWRTQIRDRMNGDCTPLYETEQELACIRAEGRTLRIFASVGIGALGTLTNYVIGTGYKFTSQVAQGQNPETSRDLIADVQRFIDAFMDENNFIGTLDRECHEESRVDGEQLIALYDGDRVPRIETIEMDCLTQPLDSRDIESWVESKYGTTGPHYWKYGVHTLWNAKLQRNDTAKPVGYHLIYDGVGREWDYIPASRMVHIKRNVPRRCLRGVSDFVGITEEITDEKKLGRNTARGAAIQAAIAYIREHVEGASKSSIESMISGNATTDYDRAIKNGTRNVKVETLKPGTVRDIPYGMKYHAGPLGDLKSPIFIQVAQYVLRKIGIRWSMPEYIISADASNANMASTLVAESPFVKSREADQSDAKRWMRELIWKAMRMAYDAGRFARHNIEWAELERVVNVKIDAPEVASRDKLNQAQTNEILARNGVLSKRTWAIQSGLDYVEEVREGAEQQQLSLPAIAGDVGDAPPPVNATAGRGNSQQDAPENIAATQSLNGAQITAAKDILASVSAGTTADLPAIELLVAVGIERTKAVSMVRASRSVQRVAVEGALEAVTTTDEAKRILQEVRAEYP